MPTADEFASALEQLIALGLRVINQGLSLRRAIDNQTPDLFEKFLESYVRLEGKWISIGESENPFFPPAPGEEYTDFGRRDWVKGRSTVIRELANLDFDTLAWQRGSEEVIRKMGGLEGRDPALVARYKAAADEIRKLRTWTVPAGKFAAGYIKPPASGGFLNEIAGIVGKVGIDLDGLMRLLDGIKTLAGFALVVLAIYVVWRLIRK